MSDTKRFTAADFLEAARVARHFNVTTDAEREDYAAATLEGLAAFRARLESRYDELLRVRAQHRSEGQHVLAERSDAQAAELARMIADFDRLVPLSDPLPETNDAQA